MFSWSEYIFNIIVLHLAFATVTRTLIHSHKSPVFRDPTVQTTDGDFIVRAPGFSSSAILRIWVATPRAQNLYIRQHSQHLLWARLGHWHSAGTVLPVALGLCSYWLNYLLTYLLTNCTKHSPSWEANCFSASQEISRILWNPKVYHRIHKRPLPVPILSQVDPVHTWFYILWN